jgi:hypothetical protein
LERAQLQLLQLPLGLGRPGVLAVRLGRHVLIRLVAYAATSPFWNYNVDYIMGGLFWPNGAYAWPSGGYAATAWTQTDNSYTYAHQSHQDIYSSGPVNGSGDKQTAAAQDDSQQQDLATCSGFAPGVSSLPIDKIEQSVKPTGMQLTALKSLEAASSQAEGILKTSCPSEPPLTPVGRLDELQKRLDAMAKGLDLVSAPLTKFDSSLSAEQKQQVDAMGGGKTANAAGLCSTQNEEFTNAPTQEIEATVKPDEHQKAALDEVDNACQGCQHASGDLPIADPGHYRGPARGDGQAFEGDHDGDERGAPRTGWLL